VIAGTLGSLFFWNWVAKDAIDSAITGVDASSGRIAGPGLRRRNGQLDRGMGRIIPGNPTLICPLGAHRAF